MQPLAADASLDERGLWTGLQELLSRLARAEANPDEFLDALADVVGADRAMLLLAYPEGETVALNGRAEGRTLDPAERQQVTLTLVREAESSGRCVSMSAFDGEGGTQSAQAFGILAAFAVPLDLSPRAGTAPEEAAQRGVLYLDFRDRTRLPSPRIAEFLTAAASLLASVVAQGQRLQHTRESLRTERMKMHRRPGPTLDQLLASPALAPVARQIRAALYSSDPILLTGETGTGKTLLAQLMAEASGSVPVVRAMLGGSDDLNTIASELFGHERGAFSGALARRVGLVEHADGGSLIFDEILNLPRAAQQLLLDFTQFGAYRPLGWARAQAKQSRARLICATNGDLEAAIANGAFRADLYYRIAGHRLELPPLRSRRAEIPALARDFLSRLDPTRAWSIEPDLSRWLTADAHAWPGNFRQLESTLRRCVSLALLEDPDAERLGLGHVDAPPHVAPPPAAGRIEPEPAGIPAPTWLAVQQHREAVDAEEREVLQAALLRADGVVSRAARELGIPRTSLLSRLASLGLQRS